MKFLSLFLLVSCLAGAARAALPDYQVHPAPGERLLLWVHSERGRAAPELEAAHKLAEQGVTVWSLDLVGAYFLPQLPSSMDAVPVQEVADWLAAALAGDRRVALYAVSRAAVPVLRAASRLDGAQRRRLCVLLMYPNLYASAEALAEADYLEVGRLDGLRIRVLQPRRSAATPWLQGQLDHLAGQGATVTHAILENLREGYWARETPTEFEIAESRRMDAMLLRALETWGCK